MTIQEGPRVTIVGPGWRFLSGISYYTCRLVNALGSTFPTSAILVRRLLPAYLYPGRSRIGAPLADLSYRKGTPLYDGVDWFWGTSMIRALVFLARQRPDVLVLQWWTGVVLHSYLLLATAARILGVRVVIEWHEVQDPGEQQVPGAVQYVRTAIKPLLALTAGHVVHSRFDLETLAATHPFEGRVVELAPHGPYDHHRPVGETIAPIRFAPDGVTNVLCFGVIRPHKGLEDLVAAFGQLTDEQTTRLHLTIAGETWEGCHAPLRAAAASRHASRISIVNRYVTDAEATALFAGADVVALPYRRSSSSGPLHIAMSVGLPVIVTKVGGLVEAVAGYTGAMTVPPGDVDALTRALIALPGMTGTRHADPHSWSTTVAAYTRLFSRLGLATRGPGTRVE